jgi:hypothetical protein
MHSSGITPQQINHSAISLPRDDESLRLSASLQGLLPNSNPPAGLVAASSAVSRPAVFPSGLVGQVDSSASGAKTSEIDSLIPF